MAPDMFLSLEGVVGESRHARYAGQIEVLSFEFGAKNSTRPTGGGSGAGKAEVRDLSIVKLVDRATPPLMLLCLNGKHIASATLVAAKAGATPFEFLKLAMTDCTVTGLSQSVDASGRLLETLTLAFAAIRIDYVPQRADGSADTPVAAGWDLKKNRAL